MQTRKNFEKGRIEAKDWKEVFTTPILTAGSVGAAGVWVSSSDQMGARVMRGIVAETRRRVGKPLFIPRPATWDANGITAAWLGHSTVLLNFFGVNILTDPVLEKRVGAGTVVGNVGPKRLVAPALKTSQLPPIDLILLSHAHMDHLDPSTIRDIPGKPQVVSAHATLDLLEGLPLGAQKSLRWGESARIRTAGGDDDLLVKAFEVKHWGARWRVDRYRGYNGYVLSRGGKSIIFGGDTAMTTSFQSLRARRPHEFAIMPIGAYLPWINSHCAPEQAVRMAEDAGANVVLPIHFKTFPLGREGTQEPLERLDAAIDSSRIGWRDIGETFTVSI